MLTAAQQKEQQSLNATKETLATAARDLPPTDIIEAFCDLPEVDQEQLEYAQRRIAAEADKRRGHPVNLDALRRLEGKV